MPKIICWPQIYSNTNKYNKYCSLTCEDWSKELYSQKIQITYLNYYFWVTATIESKNSDTKTLYLWQSVPIMLCSVREAQSRRTVPLLYLKRTFALVSSLRAGELTEPLPPFAEGDDAPAPDPSSSPDESLYWIILVFWGSTCTGKVSSLVTCFTSDHTLHQSDPSQSLIFLSLYSRWELLAVLLSSPAQTASLSRRSRPPSLSPAAGVAAAEPSCLTHPSHDPRWSAAVSCQPATSLLLSHPKNTVEEK